MKTALNSLQKAEETVAAQTAVIEALTKNLAEKTQKLNTAQGTLKQLKSAGSRSSVAIN